MKAKKLSILLVIVLALSSILMACGKEEPKKEETVKKTSYADKQELSLLDTQEIPSLDPSIATDAVSFLVMTNTMEGLYSLGKNDEIMPGLAKSEKVSADGKTWTFTLRDAKWSNGDKITAADFVYSWQRGADPATKAEYAFMFNSLVNGEDVTAGKKPVNELGVKAVNDNTLEVKLVKPVPYFKALMAFATFVPQQQKFFEAQAGKYGQDFDKVLYNGPFKLTGWEHEVGWTYEKNPNYWDKDTVKLTKINVKIVKDDNTRVSLYETNQVDRAALIAEQIPKYKDREDYTTEKDVSVYFLRMNEKNPVLKNVNARKAIAMAFDKDQLCNKLLNNGSVPANFLVPGNFLFDKNKKDFREANKDMNTYNAEKAKEYWTKAKEELKQDAITLKFLNYDTESAKKIGEFLQEQLQKNLAGLTVTLDSKPFKQKLAQESAMDYDFSYAGWGPDYPDPMTFIDMFVTDGDFNQMGYSNKDYDEKVKKAGSDLLTDLDKRWVELQKAEKILIEEDQAIAPLYQRGNAFLLNPKVKNLYNHNFGGDYSYKWTYLEK